jgi:hypothetical protein
VIIAIKPAAMRFLLRHRADTFGNSPIVFCNVGKHEKVLDRLPPGVAGAVVDYAVRPSLDLIQKLQPDTDRVVIVLGASTREAQLWELARSQIASSKETLPIEPWVGLQIKAAGW